MTDSKQLELERLLGDIEHRLSLLQEAMAQPTSQEIEASAQALQRSLVSTLSTFERAARDGPLPVALRRRMAELGGRVAALREALARATVMLDRAVDTLITGLGDEGAGDGYDRNGRPDRR